MKSKILLIALMYVLIMSSTANAQQWVRTVNLKGYWKFSIGDDANWSKLEYDDKNWEEIKAPSAWEDQGYYGYDGYAWYRKHFKVYSTSRGKYLTLRMGRVDDVDQVYVNGNLVGASGTFPPKYKTAYYAWREYYIPEKYLRFDNDNVVAVRVYDAELGGGIVEGDLGLFEQEYSMKPDLDLAGQWKFKTGDDLKWKDQNFDDKNWGNIIVPGYWETQGFPDYDGFAWYRINFNVSDELAKKRLVLILGRIDDIDEVYLNGTLVGSTGDMNDGKPISFNKHGEYQKFRGYYLTDGIVLSSGENTIAVRVYDGYNVGGIYNGPIGLITQEKYVRFWRDHKYQKNKKNFWEWFFE